MIYMFLLQGKSLDLIDRETRKQIKEACCERIFGRCCEIVFELPFFLKPAFAPEDALSNIMGTAAHLLSPRVHLITDLFQLAAFSGTGALHTDIPLSHFFNNIGIELGVGSLTWLQYSESCHDGFFYDSDWDAFLGCLRVVMEKLPARESLTSGVDVYLWSSGPVARILEWVQTEL